MAAFKNPSSLFFLIIIIATTINLVICGKPTSPSRRSKPPPRRTIPPSSGNLFQTPTAASAVSGGGEWALLHPSIGISAMHMQLLHDDRVVIFDRTDFGPSNITLPDGKCRVNDKVMGVDCTAHSVLYDVASNTFRPLMVQTDVWCSSGSVNANGTLVQTGGYNAGDHKIRHFNPCHDVTPALCDWFELPEQLAVQRWYASDQILPDGRVIVVGGRRAFSYEFFPRPNAVTRAVYFRFLAETTDPGEENNLYPFLYLLPDGNLFIFANKRSVLLDYNKNKIIKEFPEIPGEKRSYPATGSSAMLPVRLTAGKTAASPTVEIMICGGANGGAYTSAMKGTFLEASKSCGRIRVTDPDPKWAMEDMPISRVMPDMLMLPSGDVLILNGASKGSAGWECGDEPVFSPVLYHPDEPDVAKRFNILNRSGIARMYHSAATLLPDGRILVGGSNPHDKYRFQGVKYPTQLSLEAFSPPYLAPQYSYFRPAISSIEGASGNLLSYGQKFTITISLGLYHNVSRCWVTMVAPSFNTHSVAMNQRLLVLYHENVQRVNAFSYNLTVHAPANANIAPPGFYMVFVVHQGVPCHSVWFRIR